MIGYRMFATFLLGFLSFLIVAFSQPSFLPWLGPVAAAFGYALFWRSIRMYPFWKQRFCWGSIWYCAVSLVQLSWMTAIEYQGLYILLVWLGLSIWVGLQFGLLTLLIPYNRPLKLPRILAIASVWTLIEWSRFYFLCGYSWNLSGLALSNLYSLQWASVFGILGLSFWVILTNLLGLKATANRRITSYVSWAGIAAFPYLFGVLHLAYHQKEMDKLEGQPYSCVLVQTGVLPSEKTPLPGKESSFVSPQGQWKNILNLVKNTKGKAPDLIVLPEAAVPFSDESYLYPKEIVNQTFREVFGNIPNGLFPDLVSPYGEETDQNVSNAYWVQTLSNLFESEVVIGLDHYSKKETAHSSAFQAKPFKNSLERYDKRILVPLIEYLPFAFLAPLVKSYGISEFFAHGNSAKVFEGKIPISVSICYEETFPQNVREGRLKGAKMLVNVTNDGWYPFSLLPSQHFSHARFRAVENGAPLLRACNTGISAAVDSLGRPTEKLEQAKEKKLVAKALYTEINPYEYPTLFTIWGNGGIVVACVILVGIFGCLKKEMLW